MGAKILAMYWWMDAIRSNVSGRTCKVRIGVHSTIVTENRRWRLHPLECAVRTVHEMKLCWRRSGLEAGWRVGGFVATTLPKGLGTLE